MFTLIDLEDKKIISILFIAIIILAAILRVYKLDQVPPSLSWDETAVGYNAFTIANFGRDEFNKAFPIYFKSFEDDKHPVHIYFTALAVKLLGLSEFSVRFPSAFFGLLNVILIFYLGKSLFKNNIVGLSSAFFLAISPYAVFFSRFNHELNFALFFFMLGLLQFLKAADGKIRLLPFSFFSFGICLLTYHPSKVVVPTIILLLLVLYFKTLLKEKL